MVQDLAQHFRDFRAFGEIDNPGGRLVGDSVLEEDEVGEKNTCEAILWLVDA